MDGNYPLTARRTPKGIRVLRVLRELKKLGMDYCDWDGDPGCVGLEALQWRDDSLFCRTSKLAVLRLYHWPLVALPVIVVAGVVAVCHRLQNPKRGENPGKRRQRRHTGGVSWLPRLWLVPWPLAWALRRETIMDGNHPLTARRTPKGIRV